jgi:hypothetical protein
MKEKSKRNKKKVYEEYYTTNDTEYNNNDSYFIPEYQILDSEFEDKRIEKPLKKKGKTEIQNFK